MRHWRWIILGLAVTVCPGFAEAQECHGRSGIRGVMSPWVVAPFVSYSAYSRVGYPRTFQYQIWGYPGARINPFSPDLSFPQPLSVDPFLAPDPSLQAPVEPTKVPAKPSSPAARLRSLEHQARGDQRLRDHKWSEARAAYRAAVDAAPDRAEAHLRLGMSLLTIKSYESAIREFKRAVFLDPKIAESENLNKMLFGPDGQVVRSSIISKVTDWVREDYRNSDRLFVMGAFLHFEGDVRGREFLEAARRMKRKGDNSHILAFMGAEVGADDVLQQDDVPPVPELNDQPMPIPAKLKGGPVAAQKPAFGAALIERRDPARPVMPLPGAPVPMPDL